jgi:hypothetical protein
VVPLTRQEEISQQEIKSRREFDDKIKGFIGKFNEDSILDVERDEMVDPVYDDLDNDDAEPTRREAPHGDELNCPDEFTGAQIFLPHGDRAEITKVIGRKRNRDGNLIGHRHINPIIDSRIYIVEFPDGSIKDISFNILAEHLFSQVDDEGKQHRLFCDNCRPPQDKAGSGTS